MSEKEPDIQDDVIEALMNAWQKHPQLRLTQLIVNAIAPQTPCPEIFYTEDSKLVTLLNEFSKTH